MKFKHLKLWGFGIPMVMVAIACRNSSQKAPQEKPVAGPNETEAQAGFDAPKQVFIVTNLDKDANDIPGSAEMRIVDTKTELETFNLAEQAFSLAGSVNTLDNGTVVRWSPYQSVTNYSDYQPQVDIGYGTPSTYVYAPMGQYSQDGRRIYIYGQPQVQGSNRPVIVARPSPFPSTAARPTNWDQELQGYITRNQLKPLSWADKKLPLRAKYELGKRLFTDKTLSVGGTVACISCHIERNGTSNGLSLSPTAILISGQKRPPFKSEDLLPRNAPALFNLADPSVTAMFWDGRVEVDASQPSGFKSPLGNKLPKGLENVAAAQSLLPLISPAEMGCSKDTTLNVQNPQAIWDGTLKRVLAKPGYQEMFSAAYPGVRTFNITHIANAIAAFERARWRTQPTAFDRYLAGDRNALTTEQKAGATYFFGKGQCASCHSGPLFSDQSYHAIGMPQFGAGMNQGKNGLEDQGRGAITGQSRDLYSFRTPSLRNVAQTGPWGHNGAYRSLGEMVAHYNRPRNPNWSPNMIIAPQGFNLNSLQGAWADPELRAKVANANQIQNIQLSPQEVNALVAFLNALSEAP